jgi:hypothetical protein
MIKRSLYEVILREEAVCVVDMHDGTSMSVTNDAERVVEDLAGRGLLDNRRLIYKDTNGVWDEIQHKDGRFVGFKTLGATDLDAALRKIRGA